MKLRVSLLALLIAGLVGLAFFHVKPGEDGLVEAAPPPASRVLPDPEPPPAPAPETDEQRAARLKDLNPALREAIIRLENAARQWENKNPDFGFDEWEEFRIAEIAKLETPQILEIQAAIRLGNAGWLDQKFHSAMLQVWAYREPAMARNDVVMTAEANGVLDGPGSFGDRHWRVHLSKDIQLVRLGYARRDPLAAWQQLLEDLADPRRKYLSSELLWADVLEFYAKQHPDEAWREIISRPDLAFHLVEGFAMGAPPGQDWPARLEDYASQCRNANGREPGADKGVTSLLARWLAEDPDAALAWVGSHLTMQNFQSGFGGPTPPPDLPGGRPPSDEMLVKLEMMRRVYDQVWIRRRLLNEIFTRLIASEHRDLAVILIIDKLDGTESDRRLYPLIRSFPDAALREALLLAAVRKICKPVRDFANFEKAEKRVALMYSLWTLSADIDVPEETRKHVKSRLRVAYAAEQSAVAQKAAAR